MRGGWIVKQADTSSEFDQIHRLNYKTFAEELGQYVPDGSGLLLDRFHDRNTYFIALRDCRVVGMLAAQDRPPFSVESRLADHSLLDSLGGPLLEVRLLAIEPGFRHRLILPELLLALYRHACERAYSHLIVSGIATRIEMYRRMGFRALGPAVESGVAEFRTDGHGAQTGTRLGGSPDSSAERFRPRTSYEPYARPGGDRAPCSQGVSAATCVASIS